jgi:hypothetical protein
MLMLTRCLLIGHQSSHARCDAHANSLPFNRAQQNAGFAGNDGFAETGSNAGFDSFGDGVANQGACAYAAYAEFDVHGPFIASHLPAQDSSQGSFVGSRH